MLRIVVGFFVDHYCMMFYFQFYVNFLSFNSLLIKRQCQGRHNLSYHDRPLLFSMLCVSSVGMDTTSANTKLKQYNLLNLVHTFNQRFKE